MSDILKCPYCGGILEQSSIFKLNSYACTDSACKGYYMTATKDMWEELIRTRKALGEANEKLRHCVNMTVEELDELKGNLLIAWNALLHFSKDPIANNALKKITALEQKDVK